VAALQLDGGSWPLPSLLRQADFSVGDRVVIVAADEYNDCAAECEKLAKKLAKVEKKAARMEEELARRPA